MNFQLFILVRHSVLSLESVPLDDIILFIFYELVAMQVWWMKVWVVMLP
jgi:hypothetical protein